jgi:hypothetical protein
MVILSFRNSGHVSSFTSSETLTGIVYRSITRQVHLREFSNNLWIQMTHSNVLGTSQRISSQGWCSSWTKSKNKVVPWQTNLAKIMHPVSCSL